MLNEEKRKQERKANTIITLDGGNDKKVELYLNPTNFAQTKSLPKPQSGSKWKIYQLSAMTLHSQFNLTIHSFEDKGNFTGYGIKIVCIFYFHASMPSMWSAEYQTKIPLKFLIIIHDYANIWAINQSKSLPGFRVVTSLDGIKGWSIQTFLRGENDSK